MSYQILYDPELAHKYHNQKEKSSKIVWTTMMIAIVLSVMFTVAKNEEKHSNKLEVTTTAFSEMVDDLKAGETMVEAFSDFCVKIIQNETDI